MAVAIADVNGDQRRDVLVVNATGLEVRLGAGDGTLGAPSSFPVGLGRFLATGDLDGDGALDVVTAADSLHVAVLAGNGDGTFGWQTTHSVAKGPGGGVLVDLDGDDDPDLVCVAEQDNEVSVLLGDGAGGFGPRTDFATGSWPFALAAGDLDHDGDADVVVADFSSASLTRLLGDGAGGLVAGGTVALPGDPRSLALADLDGDTWLDAVAAIYGAFVVVPGLAGGGFDTPVLHVVADQADGLIVADLDSDARPDIVSVAGFPNRGELRRGLGGFAFAAPMTFNTPRFPRGLAVGDLNGGGKPDLVSICQSGPIGVHMGNGGGTFGGVQDLPVGQYPWALACGDLDADGHVDLVSANSGDATLSVRFGVSGGTFTAPVTLATGPQPHGVTLADADGDGHADLVVAERGPGTQASSSVGVFLGDGARGFAPRLALTVGRWAQQVAVGDLTGDALPDLAVACDDFLPDLTLLEGLGGGQWGNRQDLSIGTHANGVAIADVTRDGKPDVLLAVYGSNVVSVLPGNADGTYASPFSLPAPGSTSVAAGDVAGDGSPDLVVTGTAGVSYFTSLSGGGFATRVDHSSVGIPYALTVADLDGDGRVDVATADNWPSNSVSVLPGLAGGGLGAAIAYGGGDRPFGVATGDVNDDGLVDLVSANVESGTVSLFLNTGGAPWLPWLGVPPTTLALPGFALRASPNSAHGPGAVRYTLPRAARVALRLLDVAGCTLALLESGERPAGPRTLPWDPRGLPAGIGFLELVVDGERAVRRVAILP
jgi:hypothetical protein